MLGHRLQPSPRHASREISIWTGSRWFLVHQRWPSRLGVAWILGQLRDGYGSHGSHDAQGRKRSSASRRSNGVADPGRTNRHRSTSWQPHRRQTSRHRLVEQDIESEAGPHQRRAFANHVTKMNSSNDSPPGQTIRKCSQQITGFRGVTFHALAACSNGTE